MYVLLWLLAVILVVAGVVKIVQGDVLFGVVLIIVGLLVGPGGVSLFTAWLLPVFKIKGRLLSG